MARRFLDVFSRAEAIARRAEAVAPRAEAVARHQMVIARRAEAIARRAEVIAPRAEATARDEMVIAPRAEATARKEMVPSRRAAPTSHHAAGAPGDAESSSAHARVSWPSALAGCRRPSPARWLRLGASTLLAAIAPLAVGGTRALGQATPCAFECVGSPWTVASGSGPAFGWSTGTSTTGSLGIPQLGAFNELVFAPGAFGGDAAPGSSVTRTETYCYESGATGGGIGGASWGALVVYHIPASGGTVSVTVSGSIFRLEPNWGVCCQVFPVTSSISTPGDGVLPVYTGLCLDVFDRHRPLATRAIVRGTVSVTVTTAASGAEPATGLLTSARSLQLFPSCQADFNHSAVVTVQDIFDFLSAWFAGSPSADLNAVNGVTVQDIFDFLAAWFQGCN